MGRYRDRARFAAAIAAREKEAALYCDRLHLQLDASISTGAQQTDYMLLHRYVLARKPRVVVEFGSGKSSVVLGHALRMTGGHLFTYEAILEYHANLLAIIPDNLRSTITAVCSPRLVTEFRGMFGVRYADPPPADADFFFIDGPIEEVNGRKGACLDFLFHLERHPEKRVDALIDQKFSSQEAYQSVLPKGSVRYDPVMNIGFMRAVCGKMLLPPRQPWRIKHGDVWQMIETGPVP
jgi:hypothetical protein